MRRPGRPDARRTLAERSSGRGGLSALALRTASGLVGSSPFLRALDAVTGSTRLTALVYHRVVPLEKAAQLDLMAVSATPEAFRKQLAWLARRFDILSMDDLVELLHGAPPRARRPLVITFDDGYLDNYVHARPALVEAQLPAILFLVTDAIGTDWAPWWDRVALIASTARADSIDVGGHRLPLGTADERIAAGRFLIDRIKGSSGPEIESAISSLRGQLESSLSQPPERMMMTWDEARSMERDGIACQPHTATHPILARLDDQSVHDEVTRSVEAVRAKLERPVRAFAYPNGKYPGDFDDRAVECVRAEGIDVAFTTEHTPMSLDAARRDPMRVRRSWVVAPDAAGLFALKTAGIGRAAEALRR